MAASISIQKPISRSEYLAHIKEVRRRLGCKVDPQPVDIKRIAIENEKKRHKEKIELQRLALVAANHETEIKRKRRQEKKGASEAYKAKIRAEEESRAADPEAFKTCVIRINKAASLSAGGGHFKRRGQTVVAVIQSIICRHYGVEPELLVGHRRTGVLIKPRHIAMYLARTLTDREFVSLPMIASMFGGRDHTTVMSAVEKIGAKIEADFMLAEEVETIRKMVLERIGEKAA